MKQTILNIIFHIILALTLFYTQGLFSPLAILFALPYLWSHHTNHREQLFAVVPLQAVIIGWLYLVSDAASISLSRSEYLGAVIASLVALAITAFIRSRSAVVSRSVELATPMASIDSQSQFMNLINTMTEAFFGLNNRRQIIVHNKSAEKLLQTKLVAKQRLKDVMTLINSDKEPVDLEVLIATKSTEVITKNDLKLTRDDDTYTALDFTISPVKTSGEVTSSTVTHILVVRDITERKNLDEQREEFVSVISHELRTPIATAEADLALILNPKIAQLNERTLHYATVAHQQVQYLSNIINDISSIARLDKESFQTRPQPLDAGAIAAEIRDEFIEEINKKGLLFRVVIPDELITVITNPGEVKQILFNLMNNAVKYSESGTVTLSVDDSYNGQPGILYTVEDKGVGISKNDLQHVFERFWRSEDYRTRQSGGVGLGLYLCARLADRLKARLWAESEVGRGSKFFLFIPQQDDKPRSVKSLLID